MDQRYIDMFSLCHKTKLFHKAQSSPDFYSDQFITNTKHDFNPLNHYKNIQNKCTKPMIL